VENALRQNKGCRRRSEVPSRSPSWVAAPTFDRECASPQLLAMFFLRPIECPMKLPRVGLSGELERGVSFPADVFLPHFSMARCLLKMPYLSRHGHRGGHRFRLIQKSIGTVHQKMPIYPEGVVDCFSIQFAAPSARQMVLVRSATSWPLPKSL
jgi:hypothetical protein